MKIHLFPFRFLPVLALLALPATGHAQDADATSPPAATEERPAPAPLDDATRETCAALAKELAAHVEENKPDTWDISAPSDVLKTAADFEAELDELAKGANGREYLRHAADYLTRFEPGARFPEVLWRLAAYAETIERRGEPVLKTKLGPFAIGLLSRLPEHVDAFIEGRFLAADRHSHLREFAEEEDILLGLLAREKLRDDFRFSAASRLGFNYESRGRLDDALARFLEAGTFSKTIPSASDALLRAILILLETGKPDEALAEAEKLRAVPAEMRTKASTAEHAAGLLELTADPAKAKAYWAEGEAWFKEWVALRRTLGFPATAPEVRVPAVPSANALARQIGIAAQSGNRAMLLDALDLMAHALRWQPDYMRHFGSAICFIATRQFPESAADFRKFMLVVADHFATDQREPQRILALYQALCLVDLGEHARALTAVAEFRKHEPEGEKPDAISQGMVRLWASIAYKTGENLGEPVAALEKLLEDPEAADRGRSALSLAELYRKMGRDEDEEALLKREIERQPTSNEDVETRKVMQARLAALSRGGIGHDDFAMAVADWRQSFEPDWFAYCPPSTLSDDPRLKDVAAFLENPPATATAEEMAKVRLLAASSDELPLETREPAFRVSLLELASETRTHDEFRARLTAVVEDDRFPMPLRQLVLLYGLETAIEAGRKGDIAFYMTHSELDRRNPRIVETLELYGPYSQCDLNSADALMATHDEMVAGTVGRAQLGLVVQIFERLLRMGALEEAEKFYDGIGNWDLGPDIPQTAATLKLALLKALKQARRSVPFSKSMVELVGKTFDLESVEEPEAFSDLRDLNNLDTLSRATALQVRLYEVKTGRFPHTDARYWIDFAERLEQGEKSAAFSLKMLETLLKDFDGDLEKSLGVIGAPQFIDTDNPELLARLYKVFEPYRDPSKNPYTYAAIRYVEAQTDLRLGKDVDLDEVARALDHPLLGDAAERMKLRNYLQGGQKKKLRGLLERMQPDELIGDNVLTITIPALETAGLMDEAELARETATDRLPLLIARAWRTKRSGDVREICELAMLLGKRDAIPEDLFDDVLGMVRDEQSAFSVRIARAELKEDWSAMEKAATEAIERFPTFYNYYWHLGQARFRANKKDSAREPLETYTKFSKDELEYPQAVTWLEELKKAGS